jgi:hypothetical protein
MSKWLIKSNSEIDDDTGNPLYWSNEYGWTTKEDADSYSDKEKNLYMKDPEHMDGEWEEVT